MKGKFIQHGHQYQQDKHAITSHFKSLNINKKNMTYEVGNPRQGPGGLGQVQTCLNYCRDIWNITHALIQIYF